MVDAEIHLDLFNFACGDLIGAGVHRKVFTCRFNTDFVLKVEISQVWRNFANVREWQFWQDNEHCSKVKEWLCPIEHISPDGRILMQRRANPVPSDYKLPSELPAFLTDRKPENFGIYKGRLVCLDYAYTLSNVSTKMTKAEWR